MCGNGGKEIVFQKEINYGDITNSLFFSPLPLFHNNLILTPTPISSLHLYPTLSSSFSFSLLSFSSLALLSLIPVYRVIFPSPLFPRVLLKHTTHTYTHLFIIRLRSHSDTMS
jgi:hypothetical protein